ncbi:MAG: ribonuclease Z [Clostridia bacterium]|nr:ribonuclease Z [Clostridia bacterium]
MIDVCLLGAGGVMPLPNRALTSLFLRYSGSAMLLDCGEGTQTALRRERVKYSSIDVILITHLHGDHICGLTGLLLTFGLEGRVRPLKIYGPAGLRRAVDAARVIAPELPFEIIITEIKEDSLTFDEIGLTVSAFRLKHSIDCYGYRIDLKRPPKFNPQRASELGIPKRLWGTLQRGEDVGGFHASDLGGEQRRGLSVLYATDTRPVDNIYTFGKDLDLMILEGMYDDDGYLEKAETVCHLTMGEAVGIARALQPRELWLTHLSPVVTDPEACEPRLKERFSATVIGYDGLHKTLFFDE